MLRDLVGLVVLAYALECHDFVVALYPAGMPAAAVLANRLYTVMTQAVTHGVGGAAPGQGAKRVIEPGAAAPTA